MKVQAPLNPRPLVQRKQEPGELVVRLIDGRPEIALPGAAGVLSDHIRMLQDAFRERLATGRYDVAKERRDLRDAFLDRAAELGVKRKDAERLYRRWS